MAKNEKTSKTIGKIASKGLRTGLLTSTEIRKVSAAALTQMPDHKTAKKRARRGLLSR